MLRTKETLGSGRHSLECVWLDWDPEGGDSEGGCSITTSGSVLRPESGGDRRFASEGVWRWSRSVRSEEAWTWSFRLAEEEDHGGRGSQEERGDGHMWKSWSLLRSSDDEPYRMLLQWLILDAINAHIRRQDLFASRKNAALVTWLMCCLGEAAVTQSSSFSGKYGANEDHIWSVTKLFYIQDLISVPLGK